MKGSARALVPWGRSLTKNSAASRACSAGRPLMLPLPSTTSQTSLRDAGGASSNLQPPQSACHDRACFAVTYCGAHCCVGAPAEQIPRVHADAAVAAQMFTCSTSCDDEKRGQVTANAALYMPVKVTTPAQL